MSLWRFTLEPGLVIKNVLTRRVSAVLLLLSITASPRISFRDLLVFCGLEPGQNKPDQINDIIELEHHSN